jgi:hypothetical protein
VVPLENRLVARAERLEQKTRGNLTAEEREVLGQFLYELRMRFVEASGGAKRIIEP